MVGAIPIIMGEEQSDSQSRTGNLDLFSSKKGESKAAGAFGKKRGCAEGYM